MSKEIKVNVMFAKGSFGEFGNKGGLPWGHCREDMLHFNAVTMCSVIVMGRATFESLPFKLKGRVNVVLTTRSDEKCFAKDGSEPDTLFDPTELLEHVSLKAWLFSIGTWYNKDVFVIGGVGLINSVIEDGSADYIYMTRFHNKERYEADTYMNTLLDKYHTISLPDVHYHNGEPVEFVTLMSNRLTYGD